MLREKPWDKNLQLLLISIIAFNILPHLFSIPIWVTAIAFTFLGWKALVLLRDLPRPPRWFLWSTSVACTTGVFLEYETILGQEAASALLVILASAKLLETNRYRDAMFVVFTSFFLLMAHLLESQTILTTVFMAVDVLLITGLMFQLHRQERRRSARSFRPVMKTLGLAIPVWIFLFIIFPRFSTGFWGLQETRSTPGGFAENLDPGGIESLVESDEPAFRVQFDGSVPRLSELYWRGSILTESNGLTWSKTKDRLTTPDVLVPGARQKIRSSYRVYLEPRFQDWLFELDYPESVSPTQGPTAFRRRPGFIYENLRASGGVVVYDATSTAEAPLQRLLDEDRNKLLKLPGGLDPRIFELASRFASPPRSADQISDRVTEWFANSGFRYTKSPGALKGSGPEQLAVFLFTTRRGFCEHYAAAYATFMRAAGIPTRVTVGFQGASRNDYGDYFLVRDLDAHAWAEIWRDDPTKKGIGRWVRVDPTQSIAPLRIQMGGDFNLLDPGSDSASLTVAEAQSRLSLRRARLYQKAMAAWDAMQMKWNTFLTDYNFEFQKSFLETLGWRNITRGTLFLLSLVGVLCFALIFAIVLRKRAHRSDPIRKSWQRLNKKLSRAGLTRRTNEGPIEFTTRAAEVFPEAAGDLIAIGARYANLRYGPVPSRDLVRDDVRDLNRRIRELTVHRSR